jgi:hypothetical protein
VISNVAVGNFFWLQSWSGAKVSSSESSRGDWRATERAMREPFDKALVSFGDIIARIAAQIGGLQCVPQLKGYPDRDMLSQGVRWDEDTRYCGSPRAKTEVDRGWRTLGDRPRLRKTFGVLESGSFGSQAKRGLGPSGLRRSLASLGVASC